jgi:hypothetical protein
MLAVLVGCSGGLGWWLFWAGSLRSEVGCSDSECVKMISLRSDNNERSLESEDWWFWLAVGFTKVTRRGVIGARYPHAKKAAATHEA